MFGQKILVDKLSVSFISDNGYETLLSKIISGGYVGRLLFVNTRVWHFYNTAEPQYLSDGVLLPDGAPLRWIINAQRTESARCAVVPGLRFFNDVMVADASRKLRHAFVGTNEKTLELMKRRLSDRYPEVNIVSMVAPEYGKASEIITQQLAEDLKKVKPDIIWVGLGAPKQDEAAWILLERFNVEANYAGIGLVFDYIAGTVQPPPKWVNALGIEWAYRVLVQPRRTVNFVIPFLAMLRLVIWKVILRHKG